MTQPRKKRIFISYRSTDRAAVDTLVGDLNSSGEFEVWIDKRIKGGQAWWDTILDAIETSDMVIAALSPGALTSDACQKERAYALALGIPLIPVRIDPKLDMAALPPEIASRQVLGYSGSKREYDALIDALRAVGYYPGKPIPAPQRPAPPVTPSPPSRAPRRPITLYVFALLGISALIVVIAAGLSLTNSARELERLNLTATMQSLIATHTASALALLDSSDQTATAFSITQTGSAAFPTPAIMIEPIWLSATAIYMTAMAGETLSVAPVSTTPPASADSALPAALIYEGRDALTFLLTGSADIRRVAVRATDSEVVLNDDFPFVVEEAARLGAGLCLRYVRASGELPPLPNDCNPDRVFTRRLADADVFWWDDAQNTVRTLAVLNGATRVALCSGLPVRCELDGG